MPWVLFFDGECGFCSEMVRRVARWDRRGHVSFAPLQGELARDKGVGKYLDEGSGTMVLLRESDDRIWLRGDAALQLARIFGGAWKPLATLASCVPKRIRDWIYDFIARHRHALAGKSSRCTVPGKELRERLRK
jgi:predicted DCC family thiol-disulfide oxidoreductase YuxK